MGRKYSYPRNQTVCPGRRPQRGSLSAPLRPGARVEDRGSRIVVTTVVTTLLAVGFLCHGQPALAQTQPATKARTGSALARLTIITNKPGVSIYCNGAFRGKTDEKGHLLIDRLPFGRYDVRARKLGYKEYRAPLRVSAGAQRLRVSLLPTSDPAELAYQRAEQLREDKQYEQSIKEYEAALEVRRPFPEARLGLARSLVALNQYEEAQRQAEPAIAERKGRDPEGYTVLANAFRGAGQYEEAVETYRRALRVAQDFSPEAHAGLAITLEFMDDAESAIPHMRKAIAQNGDAEPILYNLLGNMYLAVDKKREAIKALEKYLVLAPDSNLASAVQSLVEQLREELRAQP
jgi:tetratricopeptide (TPR) repeat protein